MSIESTAADAAVAADATNEDVVVHDFLGMSDDDFLKSNPPSSADAETDETQKTPEELAAEEAARAAAPAATEAVASEAAEKTEEEKKAEEEAAKNAAATRDPAAADPKSVSQKDGKDPKDAAASAAAGGSGSEAKPGQEKKPEAAKTDAEKAAEETKSAQPGSDKPVDYEAFFKQVMTPFKANGRTFELKSPDEVIRLMQMGAGFGRKLQNLQPHLKVIRMLEKNDLLDEGKLSYLIDINQKNPDAIKKLIKESGIDPLDLNNEDNVSYIPRNHSVSDKEMAFTSAISDVKSAEGGMELIKEIDQKWDQESKTFLFDKPQILGVIQAQRENGIYDRIVTEIERRKVLGQIAPSMPFINAYHAVGTEMFPSDQVQQVQTQPGITQQSQVIATTTAAPKAPVKDSDKVAAAAPSKAADIRKPTTTVNPLSMPDDEFLKQFNGRL